MDNGNRSGTITSNPQAGNRPQMQPDNRQMQQQDGRQMAQYSGSEAREIRPTGDETKMSFKTTEFWIYLAAVGAVLIASDVVGVNRFHNDYFRADKAFLFITILTIGYLGSRGLAKAGSSTRMRKMGDNNNNRM
jgi:hypothetical protein